ncbi:MAG: type II toxin-antitoxin system prevent-host-death family antitoxin [Aeromicrobium sp.]|uniref:type II toxin-antitoxin system Phd/YefM family antitoxin n=1 Tax=Aeromicrobium sp. TaxID=1871063 RepID=UPI0039E51A6E
MTVTVNIHEAKTRLSELLARVEQGEEVLIARAGRPIARLNSLDEPTPRVFGFMDLAVTDAFFEPLPEEELAAWE